MNGHIQPLIFDTKAVFPLRITLIPLVNFLKTILYIFKTTGYPLFCECPVVKFNDIAKNRFTACALYSTTCSKFIDLLIKIIYI